MIDRVRVTVCWCEEAENELAEIWLNVADPRDVVAASFEVDELLRVNPASKGLPVIPELLDSASREKLVDRFGEFPGGLRRVRIGPLDVLFTAHEDDRQVRVCVVRTRTES